MPKAILIAALFAAACNKASGPAVPPETTHLLVGLASSWSSTTIELRGFTRQSPTDPWKEVSPPKTANIGRNGLAPGRGLLPVDVSVVQIKREGDGKAPAGIFELSTAYGYDDGLKLRNVGLKIEELGPEWVCVDDTGSTMYNRILLAQPPALKSVEVMRRPDGLYSRLLVVNHNGILGGPIAKDAGSCIFFHVERGPNVPTAGCTSLPAADMDDLILFTGSGAKTLYVLMTRTWYQSEAAKPNSGLPKID